jgi:hypothetical protein
MTQTQEPEIPHVPHVECLDGSIYCDEMFIEYGWPWSVKRLVLLDAVVLPKKPMVMVVSPTSIENARALAEAIERVESYIEHEVVAKTLGELLGIDVPVNNSEYTPEAGDVAIMVRLKKMLQVPQDVKNINISDLELYVIYYQPEETINEDN